MSLLFDRQVYFKYGVPGQDDGTRIDGLRVSFDVTKDDGSSANHANIDVYNLSRNTVADMQKDDKHLLLFAGYDDAAGLIFVGDITKAKSEMRNGDRVTTIESGDGINALRDSRHNKSYAPGQQASEVMGDLAGSMADKLGMDGEQLSGSVAEQASGAIEGVTGEFTRGTSVSGNAADSMTRVARANRLDWYIVDGEIRVVPQDGPDDEEAFVISPDTGLIGSPQWTDEERLEVKTLLQPDIRPRSTVRVESREFSGFFLVRSVNHKGDSGWSQDFYSILECTEL